MAIIPIEICTFNAIPVKIAPAFFPKLKQTILKPVWNHKRPQIDKVVLKKKTKAGGNTIPDFKVSQCCSHQDSMVLARNRHIDQWNRIDNPEMDPRIYSQLISDKAEKNTQWKKDSLFSKWCWEN